MASLTDSENFLSSESMNKLKYRSLRRLNNFSNDSKQFVFFPKSHFQQIIHKSRFSYFSGPKGPCFQLYRTNFSDADANFSFFFLSEWSIRRERRVKGDWMAVWVIQQKNNFLSLRLYSFNWRAVARVAVVVHFTVSFYSWSNNNEING